MYRTLMMIAIILGFAQSVEAQRKPFAKNEVVYITKDNTNLMDKKLTAIKTLPKGTKFTVIKDAGKYIGGRVIVDGKSAVGYVLATAVSRTKPKMTKPNKPSGKKKPDDMQEEPLITENPVMIDALKKADVQIFKDGQDRVRSIKISQRAKVTDQILNANLAGAPDVEELIIQAGNITDRGLRNLQFLTKLRKLTITDCNITDAGLVHIRNLKNLAYLDLNFTNVSDAGLANLQSLTNIEYLSLNHTKVTGSGLRFLVGNENLREISLRENKISRNSYLYFAKIPNLEILDFTECYDVNRLMITHLRKLCNEQGKDKDRGRLQSVDISLIDFSDIEADKKKMQLRLKALALARAKKGANITAIDKQIDTINQQFQGKRAEVEKRRKTLLKQFESFQKSVSKSHPDLVIIGP